MLLTEQSRTRFLVQLSAGRLKEEVCHNDPDNLDRLSFPDARRWKLRSASQGMRYRISARRDLDTMIILKKNTSLGPENIRPLEGTPTTGTPRRMRIANPATQI